MNPCLPYRKSSPFPSRLGRTVSAERARLQLKPMRKHPVKSLEVPVRRQWYGRPRGIFRFEAMKFDSYTGEAIECRLLYSNNARLTVHSEFRSCQFRCQMYVECFSDRDLQIAKEECTADVCVSHVRQP